MANKTNSENPLDEPVPDINEPVLTPQRCLLVHAAPSYASDDSMKKYAKYKWNSWLNWLLHYTPPIPFEVVKKNILKQDNVQKNRESVQCHL